MKVPFLDLKAGYSELKSELDGAFQRVMNSSQFILGDELAAFEKEFAAYCGVRNCVGVASGLDALHLVLQAWGIGRGDQVIVPANTFIATWLAVSRVGATPIPVEPDQLSFNMDPAGIKSAITPKTKAVIPVHLYGQPANMDAINDIAHDNGLRVLEDAAQSHGARFRGRIVGSLADAAAFSFYPTKNLGAYGDGGAITTDDDALAAQLLMLRNYGSPQKNRYVQTGYNSRLDELQAALLRVRLRVLDEWNERRRAAAAKYLVRLGSARAEPAVPYLPSWAEPVWHLFVVRIPNRDDIIARLDRNGVSWSVHYPVPPHLQTAYKHLSYRNGDFPISERLSNEILSLPIGPHITDEQIDAVCTCI